MGNLRDIYHIKQGDAGAFEDAYQTWHTQLYRFILKKCGTAGLAEEVVQRTFVRLWEKREQLSEQHPLPVQLFRMGRTILIDELRKAAHVRAYEAYALQQTEPVTFSQFEYRDTLQRLEKAIQAMPPMRQKVFRLSRFEHKTYREISEELSISTKTVENHMALALKYLKRILLPFIASFLFFL